MRILLVGYGSIGKRHEEVLSKEASTIDIVTSQKLEGRNCFGSLQDVPQLDGYDYYVIASETHKHYEQLSFLEQRVSSKLVFCEKPLFEGAKELPISKNKVVVGYVLRFHPLIQKLKEIIKNEKPISATILCGQYLPTWRQGREYTKSYSAQKSKGGGVLLDLSHEIDYAAWLFGDFATFCGYQSKVSNLEIDSDDIATIIAKTARGCMLTLCMDYLDKIFRRTIILNTLDATYEIDLLANTISKKQDGADKSVETFGGLERNYIFEQMHKSILEGEGIACGYEEALNTMKIISKIQEQNI